MPLYEITFIARQDLNKPDVDRMCEEFGKIIKDGKGKVVKTEYWGLRQLTYRINKNRRGHYAMLGVDAPPAAVKEVERLMRINEDIIRLLTVRVEEIDKAPSAILQADRSREEGFDGGEREFRGPPREGSRPRRSA